jgi:transposase
MTKRKFDNEFKVMILDLLKSGIKSSQLSEDYDLTQSMINRWKREYASKSGDFSKKREIAPAEQELKSLKKELKDVKMERDILKKVVSIFSKSDN